MLLRSIVFSNAESMLPRVVAGPRRIPFAVVDVKMRRHYLSDGSLSWERLEVSMKDQRGQVCVHRVLAAERVEWDRRLGSVWVMAIEDLKPRLDLAGDPIPWE